MPFCRLQRHGHHRAAGVGPDVRLKRSGHRQHRPRRRDERLQHRHRHCVGLGHRRSTTRRCSTPPAARPSPTFAEDSTNPAGDSVSALITSGGLNYITDIDAGAVQGIAVIGAQDHQRHLVLLDRQRGQLEPAPGHIARRRLPARLERLQQAALRALCLTSTARPPSRCGRGTRRSAQTQPPSTPPPAAGRAPSAPPPTLRRSRSPAVNDAPVLNAAALPGLHRRRRGQHQPGR